MSSDCWRASESRRLLTAARLIATSGLSGRPLALREELHAEVGCLRDRDRGIRRGDEALGGDDVGDDGRAADAGALDERHLRPELRGGERRFVAAGAAAEDGDRLGMDEARGHCSILQAVARPRARPGS
jgi:hypothetical protein